MPATYDIETEKANARLIAAAPDMLDSLNYVDSIAPAGVGGKDDGELITITMTAKGLCDLRAALRKAREGAGE
jgi:hypothetical protein